jgi:GTP cyclohydrolase III
MALASSLRSTASKLMAKFGGLVTIRRITPGSYNATAGTISEAAADATIRGVLQDVNRREVNELVQASDKRLIIAAADISAAPTTTDKVLINAVVHQIIKIATIEQDNLPITYELILRA